MIIIVHWESYRTRRQGPYLRHCIGISMVKRLKPRTNLIQDSRCAYRDSSGHLPAKIQKSNCYSRFSWLRRVGENISFEISGNRNLVALFVDPGTTLTELKKQMEHETGYSEKERQLYFSFVSYWRNFGNKRYHKILGKEESTGEHE